MSETVVKESSLTAPEDRDRENRWRPEQGAPALTEEQVKEALNENNITTFVEKFPRVDRTYADPPPPMQTYGLVSFIPAKGATPNSKGVYGFAKIRGNYASELEADQRAEFLIRNVDSYHKIFHCYVGRPFPLTESSDFSAETSEIDIRKQTAESVSANIKEKKQKEQRQVEEIKQREEELKADVEKDEEDPYDNYITMKVKKAQLTWAWFEHQKKMEETKESILKVRKQLEQSDKEHPEFAEKYLEKYMEARKKAGLTESLENTKTSFMKYLLDDEADQLPF